MSLTCQKIIDRDLKFPKDFPEDARDLVEGLLVCEENDIF